MTRATGVTFGADGSLCGLVPTWGEGCLARADRLRDWYARNVPQQPAARAGHAPQPDRATSLELLAMRLIWDAPAAGDYPSPMLADAARMAELMPELSAVVWHHAAGATILAGACDCTAQPSHPAGHRDALIALGRAVRLAGLALLEAEQPAAGCVECGMTRAEMPAAEEWANVPAGTGVCCEIPLGVAS